MTAWIVFAVLMAALDAAAIVLVVRRLRARRVSPEAAAFRRRCRETPFLTDAEMQAERERDAMEAMHVRQVRDARLRGAL